MQHSIRTDDSDHDVKVRLHESVVNNVEEDERLLEGDANDQDSVCKSHFVYPRLRFSVLFRGFICLDAIVTVALWLAGGDSHYFIDNIEKFNVLQSVFDLALISMLKVPFYLVVISRLESVIKRILDLPQNAILLSQKRCNITVLLSMSFIIVGYANVKGIFIIYKVINEEDAYAGMHTPYYACVAWCSFSSLMNLALSAIANFSMKWLEQQRVIKYYNSHGQEIDKDGKPVVKNASLLRLVGLAKPEAGLLAAGSCALLITTGVQTVAPLFFGKVVDAALESMASLNRTVLILLGIYMVGSVFGLLRSWLFTLAGQRLVARLRAKLFESVILQEIAFFDVNRTGELCNRLSSDTQVLQNAITVNMSMLCRYLLQIIGSLILMFYLNASLTGVLLAVVPVVSLGAMQYGKFVRKMRKLFQDRLADAGTQAEECLSSVRTVKSFSGENKATKVYTEHVQESYKIGKKLALAQGAMDGLFSFLAYGAIAAVLWYGGKLVHENSKDPNNGITAGLLTSFLLYTLQVAMGFALLSSLYGDFMQAVGASVRIFTLLDRKPDIYVPRSPLILLQLSGEIEFKDVHFTYPSRPESEVLKGVSFRVEPGEMVALVGPSGGGKSTIVSLIERFYDPNKGSILLSGCDLKLLDSVQFRQKIAMVSQEPTLFACSIRDNIAYGKEASITEVIEAAKQANAHDFVSEFEHGYDTLVGERGVRLSGGQKQRIAIARALIMDPAVLLLDEATSALDAESEHLVQEAVDRAMKGRTVLVIAHRLSTVRNAHKVIVIDKGQIVELGTHAELLARHGVYKRLVLRQLMAGQTTEHSTKPRRQITQGKERDANIKSHDTQNGSYNFANDGFLDDDCGDDENDDSINESLIELK